MIFSLLWYPFPKEYMFYSRCFGYAQGVITYQDSSGTMKDQISVQVWAGLSNVFCDEVLFCRNYRNEDKMDCKYKVRNTTMNLTIRTKLVFEHTKQSTKPKEFLSREKSKPNMKILPSVCDEQTLSGYIMRIFHLQLASWMEDKFRRFVAQTQILISPGRKIWIWKQDNKSSTDRTQSWHLVQTKSKNCFHIRQLNVCKWDKHYIKS